MTAGRIIFALAAIAIILLAGLGAADAALEGGGPETDITGEEFTPVNDTTIALDFSNLENASYSESVTVTDNQDNVFPETGNYTWNSNNGTIYVHDSSALGSENQAFIDYNYTEPIDEALAFSSLYSDLTDVMRYLLIVLAAAAALAAVRVMGGG